MGSSFRNTNVKVTGTVFVVRDLSLGVTVDGTKHFFPYSECEFTPGSPWSEGDEVKVEMPAWLAEKKELA